MTTATLHTPYRRPPVIRPKHLIIYVILTFWVVPTIFAFAWVVGVSLKTNREFMGRPPWTAPLIPQWSNYIGAWNRGIGTMFQNSLLIATVSTVGSVAIACLAAYPIARIPFRFNQALLAYFLIGIMIPYMLTAIPVYFGMEAFRQWLLKLPIAIHMDSRWVLIILYTVAQLPFNTFVMTGFFRGLPTELEEAAAVDGASPFRTFWQIMLPLATPGISSLIILGFLYGWNEFFYALIFVKETTERTVPLGLFYLDQTAQYSAQWVGLFAGMLMAAVPVLIVFALLQDQVAKGLTVGALKG
jgi:ABC-type glycerol-3-phosphate transport system permease component